MPKAPTISPTETVRLYNPALGRNHLVTSEEWTSIGDVVREAVQPFTHLKSAQVRDYLRAMTRLCAFAYRLGGALTVEAVLSPTTIRHFLARQETGTLDEEPYLWRLARAHHTVPLDEPVRHEVGRRALQPPYSHEELEALLLAARTQPTPLRRTNLLAIIILGAGCGLVRNSVRAVCASDVHRHHDGVYVRAAGRCAKVLSEFEDDLAELVKFRPEGRLLGTARARFSTVQAHRWLDGRRGVPHLSVDRLRASYVCALLCSTTSPLEVFTWAGFVSWGSLWRYVEMLPQPSTCAAHEVGR